MIPSPNEQLCLQRAFGPRSLANITPTRPDQASPASAPALRMALPHIARGHSAAVDPLPTAAEFSRSVQAALSSTRSSFQSASQGKGLSSDLFRRQPRLTALREVCRIREGNR